MLHGKLKNRYFSNLQNMILIELYLNVSLQLLLVLIASNNSFTILILNSFNPNIQRNLFNDPIIIMRTNNWWRLLAKEFLADVLLNPTEALFWASRSLFWRSSCVDNPLHPSQEQRQTLVNPDSRVSFLLENELLIHPVYLMLSASVRFLQPSWFNPSISRVISISPAQLFTCKGPSIARQWLQPPKPLCKPVLHPDELKVV